MTVEWRAGAHALSVVLGLAMVAMGCGGGGSGDPDAGTVADEGVSPDQGMVVEDGGPTDGCAAQEDLPDEDNVDSNCDGIDGDAADAVFVDDHRLFDGELHRGHARHARWQHRVRARTRAGARQVAGARGRPATTRKTSLGRGRRRVRRLQRGGGLGAHGGHRARTSRAAVAATDIASRTLLSRLTVTAPDATTPGGSSIAMRVIRSTGLEVSDSNLHGRGRHARSHGDHHAPGSRRSGFHRRQPLAADVPDGRRCITSNGGLGAHQPRRSPAATKQNHAMPNAFDCAGLAELRSDAVRAAATCARPGAPTRAAVGAVARGAQASSNPASLTAAAFQRPLRRVRGGSRWCRGARRGARRHVRGSGARRRWRAGYWNVSRLAVANLSINDIGSRPTNPIHGVERRCGCGGRKLAPMGRCRRGRVVRCHRLPSPRAAPEARVWAALVEPGGGGGAAFMCADEGVHNGTPNNYDELWVVMTGGAGGGGGAGGCAGAGGAPGSGGGASIAIFVWESTPTFVRVTATGGAGDKAARAKRARWVATEATVSRAAGPSTTTSASATRGRRGPRGRTATQSAGAWEAPLAVKAVAAARAATAAAAAAVRAATPSASCSRAAPPPARPAAT
jgi:hypothetical protein